MVVRRTWPALMDEPTAAAYLGVGRGSLRALLRRCGASPVELGVRLRRWRRSDLDRLVADLPLRQPEVEQALAAVEARLSPRGRP